MPEQPPYVCANGHPVPLTLAKVCDRCMARVVYEPTAHGMALAAEVERLQECGDEVVRVAREVLNGRAHSGELLTAMGVWLDGR